MQCVRQQGRPCSGCPDAGRPARRAGPGSGEPGPRALAVTGRPSERPLCQVDVVQRVADQSRDLGEATVTKFGSSSGTKGASSFMARFQAV
ncbi:hypothetical protein STENM223S_10914 [Streptomyces tendae]